MSFLKYRNNSESFRPNTPRAIDIPYESIPYGEILLSDFTWEIKTSAFSAVNHGFYDIDATSGDINVTLPDIALSGAVGYIVFKRSDTTDNTVRLICSTASDKLNISNGTYDTGGLAMRDHKIVVGNRPFYLAQTAINIYNIIYINSESYPYDRNNVNNPTFI